MSDQNATLSKPSAAFAIASVALIAITQPSGRVLGFPKSYNAILRSSPFVCATSSLDTVFRYTLYCAWLRSWSVGFNEFARFRYPDRSEVLDVGGLRQGTLLRNGFFVLVVIPQALKIFATKGASWVQAIFAFYLISYVFDEITLIFAWNRRNIPHTPVLEEDKLRLRIAGRPMQEMLFINSPILASIFAAQDALCRCGYLWLYGQLPVLTDRWSKISLVTWSMAIFIGNTPVEGPLAPGPEFVVSEEPRVLIILPAFHLVMVAGSTLLFSGDKLHDVAVAAVLVIVAALFAFAVIKIVGGLSVSQSGKRALHVVMGSYFLLVHLAAAILVLAFEYNGTNPSGMSWTR